MMKKVLIIDDDSDIRDVLIAGLEGKYELREADSREEGTKAVKEFVPDLVVLDVMMETRDSGFEMSREFRRHEQLKHAKILMLTNIDNETQLDFKKYAGDPDWLPVDGYIVKPIDLEEFSEKVEKLIGR